MKKNIKSKTNWKLIFGRINKFVYGTIYILLLLIGGAIALSALNLPGNFKILTVQSGSMEPSIHTGSVVIIQPANKYEVGEVVTALDSKNKKYSITHRIKSIVEKDGITSYETKGDANAIADDTLRPSEDVIGKVLFSIPLLGYPIAYAKTQMGLIVMIVIPAVLIIYSELLTIKAEALKLIRERKVRKLNKLEKIELEIGTDEIKIEKGVKKYFRKVSHVTGMLLILGVLILSTSQTGAYLTDSTTISSRMTAAEFTATDLNFYWTSYPRVAAFKIIGDQLSSFDSLDFEITYPTQNGIQGVKGKRNIYGASEIIVNDIVLGTCTTNANCTYDTPTGSVKLEVVLHGVITRTLTADLSLH